MSIQLLYSERQMFYKSKKLYRMKLALIAYEHFSNHFKNLEDQMSKRRTSRFASTIFFHSPWTASLKMPCPNDLEQSACLAALR